MGDIIWIGVKNEIGLIVVSMKRQRWLLRQEIAITKDYPVIVLLQMNRDTLFHFQHEYLELVWMVLRKTTTQQSYSCACHSFQELYHESM